MRRLLVYVAADRPNRAARSLRRMVDEAGHQQLWERLVVWKGPLDFDLRKEKTERCFLAGLAESLRVVGGRVSLQISETIARTEVCVLHHQRNAQQGEPKPKALADVMAHAGSPPAWTPSRCSGGARRSRRRAPPPQAARPVSTPLIE